MSSEVSGQPPHGRYYAELVTPVFPGEGSSGHGSGTARRGREEGMALGRGGMWSAGGQCTPLLGYCASRLRQEPVLVRTEEALFRP